MNETSCKMCKEKKVRILRSTKVYGTQVVNAYVDAVGSYWGGLTCPDCTRTKARAVAKKRRLELRPIQKRPCTQCGIEFETRKPNKKRCSKACSYKHLLNQLRSQTITTRTCEHCSSSFESRQIKWYCSAICKKAAKKPRKPRPKIYKLKIAKSCQECGAEHFRRYWCSDVCKKKNYNKSSAGKVGLKLLKLKYKKAARKARKLQQKNAIPKWVKKSELCAIYNACPPGMHVDHIIPLNHPLVCGLHCPDNLQYLTKEENEFKSNQFDGTYENEGWRKFFGARNKS